MTVPTMADNKQKKTMTTEIPNGLTPREVEILCLIHQCFKVKPEVDNAKLAELAGFANAESCRTNLSKILKKAAGGAVKTAEDRSEKSASPEVTKKMAGGRKRKADATNGDDDQETPTKKASPRKGKKGGKSEAESEENETEVKEAARAEDADDGF